MNGKLYETIEVSALWSMRDGQLCGESGGQVGFVPIIEFIARIEG